MKIRAAIPADAGGIREVHLSAFETSLEADLVERLRDGGDAVISLVAEDAGEIIGHVLFSRMDARADGRAFDALGLAPVAVVPGRQRQGIGSALIEAGLDSAGRRGTDIVFVLGEPGYYGRFGFDAETAKPFASPYAGEYFQAKALRNEFEPPESGQAKYATAFAELE